MAERVFFPLSSLGQVPTANPSVSPSTEWPTFECKAYTLWHSADTECISKELSRAGQTWHVISITACRMHATANRALWSHGEDCLEELLCHPHSQCHLGEAACRRAGAEKGSEIKPGPTGLSVSNSARTSLPPAGKPSGTQNLSEVTRARLCP